MILAECAQIQTDSHSSLCQSPFHYNVYSIADSPYKVTGIINLIHYYYYTVTKVSRMNHAPNGVVTVRDSGHGIL